MKEKLNVLVFLFLALILLSSGCKKNDVNDVVSTKETTSKLTSTTTKSLSTSILGTSSEKTSISTTSSIIYGVTSSTTSTSLITTTTILQSSSSSSTASTSTVQSSIKEFSMTAKQWEFNPSTITVNNGDTVRLHITSIDINHGFALPSFGVSEQLTSGNTVNIEFVADSAGTFTFFCNVVCGAGHSNMKGQLVVV